MTSSSQSVHMSCRLCGAETVNIGMRLVLGRHEVSYYRCRKCGFRQTDEPWWLDEAYAQAINRYDTGCIARPLQYAAVTKAVVAFGFGRNGRFLDYGGGHGVFARRMRDMGLDFRWEDRYCSNLFASGYEAAPADEPYILATCFEVVEHLVDPQATILDLLRRAPALLFSTELAPERDEAFFGWQYLGCEHGQHVAFYSKAALLLFAKRHGLHFATNDRDLHLFTNRPLPAWKFRLLTRGRIARSVSALVRWPALTLADQKEQYLRPPPRKG